MIAKSTICLWFNGTALEAAQFYAKTFPDSALHAIHHAPADYPAGKQGDVLVVEFTVAGIPCIGMNGGPGVAHSMAFSFQIATDTQEETDRLWDAIISNGGAARLTAIQHPAKRSSPLQAERGSTAPPPRPESSCFSSSAPPSPTQ